MNIGQRFWKTYQDQLLKNISRDEQEKIPLAKNNLVFVTTSRCNFSCKHCMRDFKQGRDLPLDIAEKTLKDAKKYNYRNVCLTGGEPTLHPQFEKLIELIVEYDYTLTMPTNGYNFQKFSGLFKKFKNNILAIAFSLESIDKQRHDTIRQKGSFDALLEDFKICRELKIPFRIITAVSAANYDEIFNIALFAKKKGAQGLAITTVLPCPRSNDNKLVLSARQRKNLLFLLYKIPKIIKIPIMIAADICANNNIKMCTSLNMNEITIDMDGNLIHCCEMSNYDSQQIWQGGVITSLKDKTFAQALKIYSEYTHKFACERIDDYESQNNTNSIDFHSCFYCVNKLSSRK